MFFHSICLWRLDVQNLTNNKLVISFICVGNWSDAILFPMKHQFLLNFAFGTNPASYTRKKSQSNFLKDSEILVYFFMVKRLKNQWRKFDGIIFHYQNRERVRAREKKAYKRSIIICSAAAGFTNSISSAFGEWKSFERHVICWQKKSLASNGFNELNIKILWKPVKNYGMCIWHYIE